MWKRRLHDQKAPITTKGAESYQFKFFLVNGGISIVVPDTIAKLVQVQVSLTRYTWFLSHKYFGMGEGGRRGAPQVSFYGTEGFTSSTLANQDRWVMPAALLKRLLDGI